MILRPLDQARVRMLHALGPVSRSLVVSRERRVAVGAIFAVCLALLLATGAPLWALAIGPLVLGVPHITSDLRYLVVRTGLGRERWLLAAIALPLAATAFGGGLRAGTIAAAAALLAGSRRRALLGLALLGPVAYVAWHSPARADVVFAHVHNLIAVLLWWGWRKSGERAGWRWLALGAMVFGAVLILSGALGSGGLVHGPRGFDLERLTPALAPGLSRQWAARVLALYAFGQTIHYAVWLRLVPDEDRKQATPRSWTASWRALSSDLGVPVLGLMLIAGAIFAIWGFVDVTAARTAYLRSAAFHGHLELVALAFAFARGRLRA